MSAVEHTTGEAWQHAETAHKRITRHDDILDLMRNRPPVWAAAVVSLLTLLLGGAVSIIGMLIMFGVENH